VLTLLPSNILQIDGSPHFLDEVETELAPGENWLRIVSGGDEVRVLTASDRDAFRWVLRIEHVKTGMSECFLDLAIFLLAAYSPSVSIEGQVVAAVASPFVLFTVSLLNEPQIDCGTIFNILVVTRRIDFFIRAVYLAEISSGKPNETWFAGGTALSSAIIALFRGVAGDGIGYFAAKIEMEKTLDIAGLLGIIYSFLPTITRAAFYLFRALVLVLVTIYPDEEAFVPIVRPLFNFLRAVVGSRKADEAVRTAIDGLADPVWALTDNWVVRGFRTWLVSTCQDIPWLEGNKEALPEQGRKLYQFICANAVRMTEALRSMIAMNPSANPVCLACDIVYGQQRV
jgi:hypothetical protein